MLQGKGEAGDNAGMRHVFFFCLVFFLGEPVLAWNAAGHRQTAVLAWERMRPATRNFVREHLLLHPDAGRWREKAGADDAALLFAEAATWADSIRHDPRFRAGSELTPALPGFPEMSAHADWHYVNIDRQGRRRGGQIDTQIVRLLAILERSRDAAELAWALPWLAHLVGDIHQPLHTGYSEDRGGNGVLVEDPARGRQPFVKLHAYWDDLPGASGLRGKKLRRAVAQLQAQSVPSIASPSVWLAESQQLLPQAYPASLGSVSFVLTPQFTAASQKIAQMRLAAAAYRLAAVLDAVCVSRETQQLRPLC